MRLCGPLGRVLARRCSNARERNHGRMTMMNRTRYRTEAELSCFFVQAYAHSASAKRSIRKCCPRKSETISNPAGRSRLRLAFNAKEKERSAWNKAGFLRVGRFAPNNGDTAIPAT